MREESRRSAEKGHHVNAIDRAGFALSSRHDCRQRLSAFFAFGIGQGLFVFVLAFFLRKPSQVMPVMRKKLNLPQTRIDFTPPQVLRTPIFWVMYLVFVMVAGGGLMVAAQIAPKRMTSR